MQLITVSRRQCHQKVYREHQRASFQHASHISQSVSLSGRWCRNGAICLQVSMPHATGSEFSLFNLTNRQGLAQVNSFHRGLMSNEMRQKNGSGAYYASGSLNGQRLSYCPFFLGLPFKHHFHDLFTWTSASKCFQNEENKRDFCRHLGSQAAIWPCGDQRGANWKRSTNAGTEWDHRHQRAAWLYPQGQSCNGCVKIWTSAPDVQVFAILAVQLVATTIIAGMMLGELCGWSCSHCEAVLFHHLQLVASKIKTAQPILPWSDKEIVLVLLTFYAAYSIHVGLVHSVGWKGLTSSALVTAQLN